MPDRTDRLKELLGLLPSLHSRPGTHPGEGDFDESRWAAIMIKNEFGMDAVRPLAATLLFWEIFDPNDYLMFRLMIRPLGFRNPEIAKRCKYRALAEATWCLSQIPGSIPVLIAELSNENATLRANAARALGYLRATAAVEPLIGRLEDGEKEVVAAASSALKRITGKSFLFGGSDPRKWRKWWSKRKGTVDR